LAREIFSSRNAVICESSAVFKVGNVWLLHPGFPRVGSSGTSVQQPAGLGQAYLISPSLGLLPNLLVNQQCLGKTM
jgi:hypothetical protein